MPDSPPKRRKKGECRGCGRAVSITKSGFPHAHKADGKQCPGVAEKVLAGEADETVVLASTRPPRPPRPLASTRPLVSESWPQAWCLVCGKKTDIDGDTRKIKHHGHCKGNGTVSHPYPPSDDEFTPPEIYEPILRALGRKSFAFDPASHPKAPVPADVRLYFEHDGLSFNWDAEGVGWGQPPYSNPRKWIRRFAAHPGGMVCLLNGDFSTSVWKEVIWSEALFTILLYNRVKHISPYRDIEVQAKRPSAIVVFDPNHVIQWVPAGVAELEAMGKVVS